MFFNARNFIVNLSISSTPPLKQCILILTYWDRVRRFKEVATAFAHLLCDMDSLEEFSNARGSQEIELAGPTHVTVAHAAEAIYVYANCLNNPSTNPPWVAGDKSKVIKRLEKLVKSITVPEWILEPDCESMFKSYWEMFNFVGGIALYR